MHRRGSIRKENIGERPSIDCERHGWMDGWMDNDKWGTDRNLKACNGRTHRIGVEKQRKEKDAMRIATKTIMIIDAIRK